MQGHMYILLSRPCATCSFLDVVEVAEGTHSQTLRNIQSWLRKQHLLYPEICEEEHAGILQDPRLVAVEISNDLFRKALQVISVANTQLIHVHSLSMIRLEVWVRNPRQNHVMEVRDINLFPVFEAVRATGAQPCSKLTLHMATVHVKREQQKRIWHYIPFTFP